VLSHLPETFARVYLANARDAYTVIAFIHGVTACVALRSLTPYLDPDVARDALRYAWQTGAAFDAVQGTAKRDCSWVQPQQETIEERFAAAKRTSIVSFGGGTPD